MKKIVLLLSFLSASLAFSQQMTRFAIVDTAKIYTTYYRDSSSARKYDAKKEEFQKELDAMTSELKEMQNRKIELQNAGEDYEAVKLQTEITNKAMYLSEYTKAKNAELESMKSQLFADDEFYKRLYDTISRIAESEGYSAVLNLQDDRSVIWYSPSVDITSKVIAAMK